MLTMFTPGSTNETVALILNEITAHSESITLAKLSGEKILICTNISQLLRQVLGFLELVFRTKNGTAKKRC